MNFSLLFMCYAICSSAIPDRMKIALTGAAGHLGSCLLPALVSRGHSVRVLVREKHIEDPPVENIRGHLFNQDALNKLMQGCDALIHSAAVISVNGDPQGIVHQTNVEGTRLVMETASASGVKRVIHISSIHAYDQLPCHIPLDENRAYVTDRAFAYDRSKKAGQEVALSWNEKGMEVLVMNPTSIIGPNDNKPSKMGRVIVDLHNGRLPFVFRGGFDFCDGRDVADAIVNALTMGRPGENYLLAGKWFSFSELAGMISDASGKKIRPVNLPVIAGKIGLPFVHLAAMLSRSEPRYTNEALAAIAEGNRFISSEKAKKELGYTVRPFEETIRDTLNWFKQKGYLV